MSCVACAGTAYADDFAFDGYADVRLVVPPGEESWLEGGLGKLRFGSVHGGLTGRFVEAVGQASWHVTPELAAVTVLRVEPNQRTGIDALETYARYRPVASGDWNWQIKAGAFFPPISLENEDVGWTSPYTLTPSAIDSWVGDELRTIGAEARTQWRTSLGTVTALGALYCCNDPAGVLIALRGWTLDDRPTGLFENLLEPNVSLALLRHDRPDRTPLFREYDNRAGWYAGGIWDYPGLGRAQFLYYDNEADPSAHNEDYYAWRTKFWSAGVSTRVSGVAVMAQAMSGSTDVAPSPPQHWLTEFWSTYVLASYDLDDWRFSVRGDLFGTDQESVYWRLFGEHGRAITAAAIWTPKDWLRLTAEFIALDARRPERVDAGLSANEADRQFQLSARVSL